MADASEEETVVENLARMAERLGASRGQAEVMARQMWKRSVQLAEERQIKQVEALDGLLRLMISGSQGRGPEEASNDEDYDPAAR